MRQPSYHHQTRERLDVTMTPMIDVIFLLLIFFVCTASFQPPEEILPTRLSLPGAIAADVLLDPETLDLDEIVVKILWNDGRPRWQINDRDYDRLADVATILQGTCALQADLPVILDIAPSVPMENVIRLYDLCLSIGLQKVQFAASVKEV